MASSKIWLFLGALAAVAACDGDSARLFSPATTAAPVTAPPLDSSALLTVNRTVSYLAVGASMSLKLFASISSRRITAPIYWESRDPQIATVDTLGTVKALAVGATWVFASMQATTQNGSAEDSALVTVISNAPVTVVPSTATLVAGDTMRFASPTNSAIAWISEDTTVAKISPQGFVISRKAGTVRITAQNVLRMTGFATLTITPAPVPPPPPPPPPVDTTTKPPVDTTKIPVDTTRIPLPPSPGVSRVTLPKIFLDTMVASARSAVTQRTIQAGTRAQLQAAIDTAKFGDVIMLAPGVTYTGTITLRKKTTGSGWITIRSSSNSLPPAGTRIRPTQSNLLPRLIASQATDAVIVTEAGAHHYLLQGIEVTASSFAANGWALVALGTNGPAQSTLAQQPSQFVLDRVYVHGTSTYDFQRCLLLNTGAIAVMDSWISDCHGRGYDSQAILSYNGSGPFKIQNNYLEGAGENVMFGGADPSSVAMLPTDIEIRGNHFFKPVTWKGGVWTVKNHLELKLGLRALIEGNLFENCWVDGQGGYSVLFKTVNQNRSAPFSETRDVTFRGNIIRNVVGGIGLAGLPEGTGGVAMSRVYIADNWFDQMGAELLVTTSSVAWVFIEGNTGLGGRGALRFNGGSATDSIVMRSNVFGVLNRPADEVIAGDGVLVGAPTMNLYAKTWSVQQNVFIGATSKIFPTNTNFYPANIGAVGFVSWPNDLSLLSSSLYALVGLGSKAPGAPIGLLSTVQLQVKVSP